MDDTNTQLNVFHDLENYQFVLTIENKAITTKYRMLDEHRIEFYSTHTPKPLRGNGYAARLVNHALDYAQANNYKIIPTCWYVNKIFTERKHSNI